jgi:hypothetical protein
MTLLGNRTEDVLIVIIFDNINVFRIRQFTVEKPTISTINPTGCEHSLHQELRH